MAESAQKNIRWVDYFKGHHTLNDYKNSMFWGVALLAAMGLSELVYREILDVGGLQDLVSGNAGQDALETEIQKQPLDAFFMASVAAPLSEEIAFRGPLFLLPALVLGKFGSGKSLMEARSTSAPIVGSMSSALWAGLHNFHVDSNGELAFASGFSLPIFVGGMILWHLARKKGITHAITAHAVSNTSATSILYALS